MLWLFYPPLSKEEEETYEVCATAGGRDMHSYTETQSWEGPLLQEGRSVYRQCYCTGKALLQLSPETWTVFVQQDGTGKRLKVLETEAGREAQLCREVRNGLNSRAGTSHWSPTWGQTVPTLCLEAIFFISHWPVVLIGEAQSRHFNNYFLN